MPAIWPVLSRTGAAFQMTVTARPCFVTRTVWPLSERVLPLVVNRLTRPGSEHALAAWLEGFYVVTAQGSRWKPEGKPSRRVKVSFEQLRLWYETLDDLLLQKPQIEKLIWQQLRDLFTLEPELVFYDITSTYFEGQGPAELGRFGYSRDGKPRNRQVLVGVVMRDGWPIAHHVLAGNRLDQTTVAEVVADLRARLGLQRVVFVGDRGMVTLKNLAMDVGFWCVPRAPHTRISNGLTGEVSSWKRFLLRENSASRDSRPPATV
jgi:hypothetical protein